MLYQWDVTREPLDKIVESMAVLQNAGEEARTFARALAEGAIRRIDDIDANISQQSDSWRLGRMATVDRNILRVAIYELMETETPKSVVINEALGRAYGDADDIEVVRVPGAFEMPLAAQRLADTGRVAGVVCLGAIVKGGTPHWNYLSASVTSALVEASLATGVPMTNALLTTENMEQALDRAGKGTNNKGTKGNKGYDAALACVEMAELYSRLGVE